MSADLLRRAAKEMRERAKAATPGPYFFDSYCRVSSAPRTQQYIEVENTLLPDASDEDWERADFPETVVAYVPVRAGDLATEQGAKDAKYLASWHPAVALAVADWLDEEFETYSEAPDGYKNDLSASALRLARAYLGETS